MVIRVLSLNMFGAPILSKNISQRFGHIADILIDEDPDIISLQEVHLYPHLRLLKKLLSNYPYTAYKRFLYGPKSGLVIFSKHPLTNVSFTGFKDRGTIRNTSVVAKVIRNGILTAEIAGQGIVVYNTHLTPNTDIDYSENNRFVGYMASQLNQLADKIRYDALRKKEVVLTGDLNIPPESFLYDEFMQSSGLVDLFSSKNEPTYHEAFQPDDKPGRRIDYICIASGSKSLRHISSDFFLDQPISLNGDEVYLSDHCGIRVDLEITHRQSDTSSN